MLSAVEVGEYADIPHGVFFGILCLFGGNLAAEYLYFMYAGRLLLRQ